MSNEFTTDRDHEDSAPTIEATSSESVSRNKLDASSGEPNLQRNSNDPRMSALKRELEALIFAAEKPLSIQQLFDLLDETYEKSTLREALGYLVEEYAERGVVLVEVASGFRFHTRQELAGIVGRLWEEKPQRYSRALLETLALIAYRQPITRGDIEEIRGVAVSSNIIKTLMERNWIRIVGHREVPGRPAIYATTRQFLDYFNLKSLDQLPSLAEIRDLDTIAKELTAEFDFEKDVNAAAQAEEDAEADLDDELSSLH